MRAFFFLAAAALLPGASSAAERVDYARDVKPVLAKNCVGCHGPDRQRGSLRLDTAAGARTGGSLGPAAVPGKSADSPLVRAVTGADGIKAMPPRGPRLSASEVATLRAWIDAGAAPPADESGRLPAASKHWAFQPVRRPAPPTVKDAAWVREPLDRFILARLEKEGVRPSPEAERVTLLRRVSLDLLGLPPSPREVEDFLADKSPDAYERVVDRLLASPHYGERWGRHWLDAARYADSNGYSIDAPRSVWKYRDWVIGTLNRDLPFDRFVVEQLAGDLLPGATVEQRIATGFHRNTQINQEGGIDEEQFRVETVADRVDTTGSVFLGLTVGCARCHDHKFDPLSQREYYQLFAFFNNGDDPTLELCSPEEIRKRRQLQGRLAAVEKRLRVVDPATPAKVEKWEGGLSPKTRAALPPAVQDVLAIAVNGRDQQQEEVVLMAYRRADEVRHVVGGLGGRLPFAAAGHLHLLDTRLRLEAEQSSLKREMPALVTTLVVDERKTPRPTHIHIGGDFLRPGAAVTPGTPAVLPPLAAGTRPNRLDLARWLVDGKNPLTARVAVNRVWQAYFGTGFVETDNDFGTQGAPPSHPELLDWLAATFVEEGWSLKQLHRHIVTSATYRQSSVARPDLVTRDPRNRLLARQARLRLEAECVRDAALAASGLLNPKVGGPGVFPPQPSGVYAFTQVPRTWKASTGPDRYRRGLYTYFWRSAPHPGLTVFDAPAAATACTRRNRSNTPLQALTLLNDQGYYELARGFAARVRKDGGSDDMARLRSAFRLCLSREPRAEEASRLTRLLADLRAAFAESPGEARQVVPDAPAPEASEAAVWVMVARALFNLDEFITRE